MDPSHNAITQVIYKTNAYNECKINTVHEIISIGNDATYIYKYTLYKSIHKFTQLLPSAIAPLREMVLPMARTKTKILIIKCTDLIMETLKPLRYIEFHTLIPLHLNESG